MTERNYLLAAGKPIILAEPAAVVSGPNAPINRLAEWRGTARPVEVALYAENESAVYSFPTVGVAAYAGRSTDNPPISAYFEIEYGCGGIVRRRIVDLVTARVFLGTCDYVAVNARRWLGLVAWPGTLPFNLQVTASIAECSGGSYDELQATQMIRCAAGAAVNVLFAPPSGAYCWQAGITTLSGVLWGTAQPDIHFLNGGEDVVYRISTYQIVPSVRRFKPPYGSFLNATSNGSVLVANDLGLIVTWYLNS